MGLRFSERFVQARQDKRLTQKQLAERLGVTSQAISKWETGSSLPDLEMINEIAILLDCSIDYLVGHEVTEKSRINLQSVERRAEVENAISKAAITVQIGTGLIDMLLKEMKNDFEPIHRLRVRLADRYGIHVPAINLKDNEDLGKLEYRILIHGKKQVVDGILHYPQSCYMKQEEGKKKTVWYERVCECIDKNEGKWSESKIDCCQSISAMEIVICRLEKVIIENYDSIINRQTVAEMVKIVQKRYPAVTEGVVPERVSYSLLQKIIAALVMDGYSVNRLDYIIEYLEEAEERNPESLIETLKQKLDVA